MSFKVFFQWARNNLVEPRTFQSLGKRSQFQVRYNQDSNEMYGISAQCISKESLKGILHYLTLRDTGLCTTQTQNGLKLQTEYLHLPYQQ